MFYREIAHGKCTQSLERGTENTLSWLHTTLIDPYLRPSA